MHLYLLLFSDASDIFEYVNILLFVDLRLSPAHCIIDINTDVILKTSVSPMKFL